MKNETILSSPERVCEECGRKFVIHSVDLWAYKLSIKGRTKFFCRYNCVRAGERKLKNVATRGGSAMNKNKPTKDVLEVDLRSGLSGPAIAKKYNCSNPTVHKWIKDYELQDIQAVRKPKCEPVILNTPPVIDDMVQESPTLTEIEQFHTDEPTQELPKVEMDRVLVPGCYGEYNPDKYWCNDCEVKAECLTTFNKLTTNKCEQINDSQPQGMTEEENLTNAEWEAQKAVGQEKPKIKFACFGAYEADYRGCNTSVCNMSEECRGATKPDQPEPEPAPAPDPRLDTILRGSCKEVIQGVKQDLESVRRVFELQAKDFYQEILRELFAELIEGDERTKCQNLRTNS